MDIIRAVLNLFKSIGVSGFFILLVGAIIGYAVAHIIPLSLVAADEYFYKSRVESLRAELETAGKKLKDTEDALAEEKKSPRADMDEINKKVKNAESALASEQKARSLEVEKLKSEYASLFSAYSAVSKEVNDLKKAEENSAADIENSAPRKLIKAIGKSKILPCNGEAMLGDIVVVTMVNEEINGQSLVKIYLKDFQKSIYFFSDEEPIERIIGVPARFNIQKAKNSCSIRVRVAE
ncbi:hypothetical protein [Azospirillum sp. TSA6c]|uniref:hypothetical protein n=1 Tax=Azospirillum sp. TSA6c TaxID=709813 RepID=UPI0011B3722E|nr:hypothetical protein [Azospirillum sp. TSA6c]